MKENKPYYSTETIISKDKRIAELEKGINDLKSQLKQVQQQFTNLIKKQFMLKNLKSINNTAHFNIGFNNWDTFQAVYKYLGPGK